MTPVPLPCARGRLRELAAEQDGHGLSYGAFARRKFERLSHHYRRRVFDVDYREFTFPDGGRIFLTRDGWSVASLLHPGRWYRSGDYHRRGRRLPASTGTVYRLDVGQVAGREFAVVVKFSRFAQHLAADLSTTFREETPAEIVANASFNSPFLEFARLYALREAHRRTGRKRVLTKRPLAIYEVPANEPDWRLGRDACAFSIDATIQHLDQEPRPADERVELVRAHSYVLLFGWVRGHDAATLHEAGILPASTMQALVRETEDELRFQGFGVLDHKANHIILRQRRDGTLLRRKGGGYAYALIDFELLRPLFDSSPEKEHERLRQRVRSLTPACPYFATNAPTCPFLGWRRSPEFEPRLGAASMDELAGLLREHRECYRRRKAQP